MNLDLKRIKKDARFFWASFLDLIFPIECLICGKEGELVCKKCFFGLKIKPSQYCLHCKKENFIGKFCRDCRRSYFLNGVWIAGLYDDKNIAKLIRALKYSLIKDLANELGNFLAFFFRDLLNLYRINREKINCKTLSDLRSVLVVPVPLHKKRKRFRGFNQADEIVRVFSRKFYLETDGDNLVRIKNVKPQAKLKEEARRENVKNCFVWQGKSLGGRNIVLIDDVTTTGSTLNECARVLKENGAGEVWGLVLAKG